MTSPTEATATRLHERLLQTLSTERPLSSPLSQEEAADAIRAARIEGCICDRRALDRRPLTFEQYFIAVYGVGLDGRAVKGRGAV